MKRLLLLTIFILPLLRMSGQENKVLRFTPDQIEALFLKQNLELIAEQMNISIADAEIAQAKLWDNPSLSVDGVNLWSTDKQRDGESEAIPPLFGSFARNTQFSIELSQLIQTANKRGKLVAKEKVSKEIAIQEFELLLQGLKIELRKTIREIIYLQTYRTVLETQQQSLQQLIESYEKQMIQGNIARSELLRLQSSLLEFENEYNETLVDWNEQMKNLKVLLYVEPLVSVEIEDIASHTINPDYAALTDYIYEAGVNRPDMKLSKLQTRLFEKSLSYEKAQRVPDITLSASYDRFGGVWKDYIGFGVSFDLPFFNRNQGAVKAARINRDKSLYMEEQQKMQIHHEVVEAYNNYTQAYKFYQKISSNKLLTELDSMLDVYTKNLLDKNISMLEFIDFMEAYKSNKQTVLEARKKMYVQFEELQYVIGKEIK